MVPIPKQIELSWRGWRSGPVLVAATRRQRRRGLRPRSRGWGLLIRSRSVHGSGMEEPLWVVAFDAAGTVRGVSLLRPGGLLVDRDAHWLLELPIERDPPRIRWRPMVKAWRER
jgi:hypothetical protein